MALLKDIRDILKYIDAPLSLSEGTPLVLGSMKIMLETVSGILG